MKYYPVYLNLKGRRVLLVGAGPIANQKRAALMASEAKIKWVKRAYKSSDLKGARLVIAATDDRAMQKKIVKDARARGIWVNVVDVPALCDFIAPAVIERGPIQIAISTGGAAPALAKYLRRKLEPIIGKEFGEFAAMLQKLRPDIRKLPREKRAAFWENVVSNEFLNEIRQGGIRAAEHRVKELVYER